MTDSKQILIVEGETDRSFFEEFCRSINLDTTVKVVPPRLLSKSSFNSKEGVLNLLPTYLSQLKDADSSLERLAIVLDADQIDNGSGFEKTLTQVAEILNNSGFTLRTDKSVNQGILFQHNDGLTDFGLWIMPDNQNDGILENWINQCLHAKEQDLYQHSQKIVSDLPEPRFSPARKPKAEVATWLAWQAKPGESLYYAVKNKLLNEQAVLYQNLLTWLRTVFQ